MLSTDFGTRLGLASGGGKLYASWVDTSAGTPATGRQDVNFAVVDLPSGGNRGPVLAGTLGLAVIGAGAVLAMSRRNRNHSSTRTDAQNRQVVSS